MQPLSENAINIPAFLNKLWRMVNDPETDNLISWSSAGKSFIIQNQMQFWYELLPLYYKHNNMSSFVRQLNMYGFHKMSTVENGTMDTEKDEIQFYHPYFQKDKPELLKNIKRKVTGTKVISSPTSNILKSDDLSKVLSDVKVLRGKQTSVDTQLSAMKQENAVLWRELAILRQKHMKQQQIVNKLIQFLVTIVQPTARMSGLGVKRHFPLMLNEIPQTKIKKKSSTSSDGPIIHELDSVEVVPEELLVDDTENAQKSSSDLLDEVCNIAPLTTDDILLDSPELVDKEGDALVGELLDCELSPAEETTTTLAEDVSGEKVFLNPTTQDTLISNLINGGYNSDVLNSTQVKKEPATTDSNLTVARIGAADYSRLNSVDDLDVHVESTQSEIDQLKDILNGYNSFDANALLGLFNDDTPEYVLSYNQNTEDITNKNDPLVSGSELAMYDSGLMDFTQLFDDSSDPPDVRTDTQNLDTNVSINTPQVITDVPQFPVVSRNN